MSIDCRDVKVTLEDGFIVDFLYTDEQHSHFIHDESGRAINKVISVTSLFPSFDRKMEELLTYDSDLEGVLDILYEVLTADASETFMMLFEAGYGLKESIDIYHDGDYNFYDFTSMTDLAKYLCQIGTFGSFGKIDNYVLNFIDYQAMGEDLFATGNYIVSDYGIIEFN